MSKFITISQTPVYKIAPGTGFYSRARSLPVGTELSFEKTAIDPLTQRQIGILASGEVMYLDALSPLIDEVVVKSTRLWDWLLWLALAGAAGYVGLKNYKKLKK
jgi:hypothetical protein